MYCYFCGTNNSDNSKFCIKCGQKLGVIQDELQNPSEGIVFREYANLSKRIKAGDEAAFSEMYEKSSRLVYATCYGILRNNEDAHDAMQDTYVTVYRMIGKLQDDGKFLAWLKRIAATKALNIYRRRHGDVSYDDTIGNEEEITGDDNLENLPDSLIMEQTKRDTLDRIMRNSLSDVQYQTIFMFYYDEFPIELIAKLMDCPVGTVKTRLKSARVKIKEGIEAYEKKTGDKLHAAMPLPFLMRFFMEGARRLMVPRINIASAIASVSASASSAGSSAGTAAQTAAQGVRNAWEAMEGASGASAASTANSVSSAAAASAGAAVGNVGTAAAGAVGAAKVGFLATTAGKTVAVILAAATLTIGGLGIKTLVDRSSDDDKGGRTRRERDEEDETEETEEETEASAILTDAPSIPDETEPSETATENEIVSIDEDVIPKRWMLENILGGFFIDEYDHNSIPDGFANKLVYDCIVNFYSDPDSGASWDTGWEQVFDDPKGRFNSSYRLKIDYVNWFEENVMRMSDEDRARVNNELSGEGTEAAYFADDGYMYYDSNYHEEDYWDRGIMILQRYTDGRYYYFICEDYQANGEDYDKLGNFLFVMELTDVDGDKVWSVLKKEPYKNGEIKPYTDAAGQDTSGQTDAPQDERWKEQYRMLAENMTANVIVDDSSVPDCSDVMFDLIYLDEDDIPELLCTVWFNDPQGLSMQEGAAAIFTYKHGELIRIENDGQDYIYLGGFGTQYYYPHENVLHMGNDKAYAGSVWYSYYWQIGEDGKVTQTTFVDSMFDIVNYEYPEDDPNCGEWHQYLYLDGEYVSFPEGDWDNLLGRDPETSVDLEATMTLDELETALTIK